MKKYKIVDRILQDIIDNKNVSDCIHEKYYEQMKNTIEDYQTAYDMKVNRIYNILFKCIDTVKFDDNLYGKLEKAMRPLTVAWDRDDLSFKLFKKAIAYNPSKKNCVCFYWYLGLFGYRCESMVLKSLLLNEDYTAIQEFCKDDEFLDPSTFQLKCIWRGIDYEKYLEEKNISDKIETTVEASMEFFENRGAPPFTRESNSEEDYSTLQNIKIGKYYVGIINHTGKISICHKVLAYLLVIYAFIIENFRKLFGKLFQR